MVKNKTVLVVERDPKEAEKILNFFQRHDFRNRIEVVNSKTEALDFIFATGKYENSEDHEVPGLILLDLLTNKTQDAKILKPLQSYLRTQNIPIIILTLSDQQENEIREIGLGAIGFVRKPLDLRISSRRCSTWECYGNLKTKTIYDFKKILQR